MKLTRLRLSNFQSFGPTPTEVDFDDFVALIGPNGTGKTAILQALARLFSIDPSLRRVRRSDFHQPTDSGPKSPSTDAKSLWIEAQFDFPELKQADGKYATVPSYFAHMQLESADGVPRMRYRLKSRMDEDGEIEDVFEQVVQVGSDNEPIKSSAVSKPMRNAIQVHYVPARRDPTDHVSYAATSMLGRLLRSANWDTEQVELFDLTHKISHTLSKNSAIAGLGAHLSSAWGGLHKGAYYTSPSVSFERAEIENLLRLMTISFSSAGGDARVDFSRLSDGQQSLLYLSLVLSQQAIGREVLANNLSGFDINRLRPAVFTLIAVEEPENSLSPHYLGRIVKALSAFAKNQDGQAVVATHAPSLVKRISPENIRYLRLDKERRTTIRKPILPEAKDEAHKFVREALHAFPELYFSRLVILGEGDTEEIVLPRLLGAVGVPEDDAAVSVVPLGGRHVNHFWRLLNGLDIPHVTLLDLDLARNQGGWGRFRYAATQLLRFAATKGELKQTHIDNLPKWDGKEGIRVHADTAGWINYFEKAGIFFSTPLDLDFAMILRFPAAYGIATEVLASPDAETLKKVLGKVHGDATQYSDVERTHFDSYHECFKLHSKPVAHLEALAQLTDEQLGLSMPDSIKRMLNFVKARLENIPE